MSAGTLSNQGNSSRMCRYELTIPYRDSRELVMDVLRHGRGGGGGVAGGAADGGAQSTIQRSAEVRRMSVMNLDIWTRRFLRVGGRHNLPRGRR